MNKTFRKSNFTDKKLEKPSHLLEEKNFRLQKLHALIAEGKNSELLNGEEVMKKIRARLLK